MKLQRLMSYTRKAVDRYQMIDENDKIAIGISGGKDSLALLYALAGLRRFYPNKFEIEAITIALGFYDFDVEKVRALCNELGVNYTVVDTDIKEIVFDERKEKNPCSLCAKMRKGALNEKAKELGCNKVALGHHKDDIVETMMLSLFFEGRFHSFAPVTYLDRMDITTIRPLMLIPEKDIIAFKRAMNLPVVKSPCPMDGYTKREYMKDLLKDLNREHHGLTTRMFSAIENSGIDGWNIDHKDQ